MLNQFMITITSSLVQFETVDCVVPRSGLHVMLKIMCTRNCSSEVASGSSRTWPPGPHGTGLRVLMELVPGPNGGSGSSRSWPGSSWEENLPSYLDKSMCTLADPRVSKCRQDQRARGGQSNGGKTKVAGVDRPYMKSRKPDQVGKGET